MRKYLTIGETAKRLNLEVDTVRKLERTRKIRAVRTKGGHRRFTEEEIDRFRRSRRKNGGAKPKRRGPALWSQGARPATRHHPASGEFVATCADFSDELEDLEENLPIEEFDEDDEDLYQPAPPPPPTRAAPPPQVPPPKPMVFAPRPAPATPASVVDTGFTDRLRLQNIKNYGRSSVPWGVPAEWEGKVIADLERFVTPIQFPPDLSFSKAVDIVRARVTEVLGPYHAAGEKAKRDKKAKEDPTGAGRRSSPTGTNTPAGRPATGTGPPVPTHARKWRKCSTARSSTTGPSTRLKMPPTRSSTNGTRTRTRSATRSR